MSAADPVIELVGVGHDFRIYRRPFDRLREAFSLRRRHYHSRVQVLEDISFSVRRGETIGVLGPNGAGKSTLLQLIAGVLQPAKGKRIVRGRVAALLQLGAGFLPELTGRENARLFHELFQFDRSSLADRLAQIEDFAEIGPYFDRPVRTYSSGMYLRVAFATAICIEPDILIIDEALAVGDSRFQRHCYRRIQQMRDAGCTVFLVTHAVEQLPNICERALVLDKGRLVFDGLAQDGVHYYFDMLYVPKPGAHTAAAPSANWTDYGTGMARVVGLRHSIRGVPGASTLATGDEVAVTIDVEFERAMESPWYGIMFCNAQGVRIAGTSSDLQDIPVSPVKRGDRRQVRFTCSLSLLGPEVFIDVGVAESSGGQHTFHHVCVATIHLTVDRPALSLGLVHLPIHIDVRDGAGTPC